VRVLGIVGWSGSGKTLLITKIIPLLAKRGLRIATLKHAHHSFEVDKPGKDSYEHRKAGAGEVIISSSQRWVQMHELDGRAEASFAQLLKRLSPCDLVLVEGYKSEKHAKIEVFRQALGKEPLYPTDEHIVAIASHPMIEHALIPVIDLNDIDSVANMVFTSAEPLELLLARLGDLPNPTALRSE